MDGTRFWSIVVGAFIVLAVIVDAIFGIAPNLRLADQARTDQVAVDAANAGYRDQLLAFQDEQDGITELQRTLKQLQQAVPTDAGLPDFVAQLGTIADANGVLLTAVAISDAEAYVPSAAVADAVPETAVPDATASDVTTPDAAATTTDAAADAAGSAQAAASDRLDAENLATMVVTLTLAGGYENLLDFVDGLQNGERLVSITNFNSTGGSSVAGGGTGSVSFIIYVLHGEE